MQNLRFLILVPVIALGLACSNQKSTAGGVSTAACVGGDLSLDTVVATVGDKKITLKEVDEGANEQLAELEKKKFEARRQKIEQLIIDSLVKAEAAKKGMKEEEWFKTQVEGGTTPPSDAEVMAFFEQNKAQMPPGASIETIKPQIIAFMTQNQTREKARKIFEDLKKAANVQILFKEPRKQVEAKGPSRGPENAKVTIVEFSDFQCPFCSRAHDTVEEVMQAYAGKVKLVFRQFPLDFHADAPKAAEASLCANEQGKFWEYHSALFKNQSKLKEDDLKEHAKGLGLDAGKFADCLGSGKMATPLKEDMAAGKKVGVSGTPAFFINGVMLSGAQPLEEFKRVIDAELASN
jgi:protein-disulfide isomerase